MHRTFRTASNQPLDRRGLTTDCGQGAREDLGKIQSNTGPLGLAAKIVFYRRRITAKTGLRAREREGEITCLAWTFANTANWIFDRRGVTGNTGQGAREDLCDVRILH